MIDNDEANKSLKKTDNEATNLGEKFSNGVQKAAKWGKAIATGATVAGGAIVALVGTTMDLNRDLARLRTNASNMGYDFKNIEAQFKKVAQVTGETDSAVETLSNLMQSGFSDVQMASIIDDINGAAIRFSDTLKTEGIADGLQETFATGAAIGQFGELLERSGVNLDTFNAGLAQAKKNGTETDYVLQQLADLGLSSAYDEYVKLNPELAAATEATANFEIASANMAKVLSPLVTTFTNFVTAGMEWVANSPTVQGAVQWLSDTFAQIDIGAVVIAFQNFGNQLRDAFGPIVNDIITFIGILWGLLQDVTGIQSSSDAFQIFNNIIAWIKDNGSLISAAIIGITSALVAFKILTTINAAIGIFNTLMIAFRSGTLLATLAQLGLNTAMLASPLTWIAAAIGAVVAVGILLYKNWDTVKAKTGELWAKIKENPLAMLLLKLNPITGAAIAIYQNFDKIRSAFNKFKDAITGFKMPGWVSSIGSTLSNAASKARNLFPGHATGLERVPYDNYTARLHAGESVLTAKQSNALRAAGILKPNSDGTPNLNLKTQGGGGTGTINIAPSNVYLSDQVVGEIVFKVVDVLMQEKSDTERYMRGGQYA